MEEVKAKVINNFNDRITKKLCKKGDIISLSNERYKELLAKGFIEEYKEKKTKAKETKEKEEAKED